MTDFEHLIRTLTDGHVEFIIVGGLAATVHGSARLTDATVQRGLNFTLTTSAGDLDLLGEVTGGGSFEALLPHAIRLSLFGRDCRCLDLATLIKIKRAVGRPKDLEAVAELEALLEERGHATKGESS